MNHPSIHYFIMQWIILLYLQICLANHLHNTTADVEEEEEQEIEEALSSQTAFESSKLFESNIFFINLPLVEYVHGDAYGIKFNFVTLGRAITRLRL